MQVLWSFLPVVASMRFLEAKPSGTWVLQPNASSLNTSVNVLSNGDTWERQNALWTPGIRSGSQYWEMQLQEFSGGEIGVTTNEAFQPGWDLVGLLYDGGGLSDGASVLRTDYGLPPDDGDTVGVFVNFTGENTVSVSFYLNGEDLGTAFAIPTEGVTTLHPVIAFDGPGTVAMEVATATPPPSAANRSASDPAAIAGYWGLNVDALHCDDMDVPKPEEALNGDLTPALRISMSSASPDRLEYAATLTVVNAMQFPLAYDVEKKEWRTPGMRISTNNEGSEGALEFERWLNAFSFDPESITITESDGEQLLTVSNEDCIATFGRLPSNPIKESPFVDDD